MSILNDIILKKKEEVTALKSQGLLSQDTSFTPCSFLNQLNQYPKKLHLIAEVKQASPSKGIIYTDFNHGQLAQYFEENGAACISVLTDIDFFKGHPQFLTDIKRQSTLPILRKDFIIDPIQITESKQMGADIILLILDILSVNQANELIEEARNTGLEVLLEIHSEKALEELSNIVHKPIVGINNRDLHTFSMDFTRSIRFSKTIKQIDPEIKLIAESGIIDQNQLVDIHHNQLNGVLIGEGLSRNPDLVKWFNQ